MTIYHILPVKDLKIHKCSKDCWCFPLEEKGEHGIMFIHNAKDTRERVERQGMLDNGKIWDCVEE